MEKKQLNEKSFASINKAARYIPDGMTTDEFERWLLNNGFYLKDTFHEVRDPNSGDLISSDGGHLWVRKENKVDDKKNFYSSVEEPSLREILLNVAGERGTINNPVSVDAYNVFARWDVWPGGYVERLGFVDEYAASVDYGCSIFTTSWIRRGAAENPVHVFQFYQLVQDGKWHGGDVETWGTVSGSIRILGASASYGFETSNPGEDTLGSLANLEIMLGRNGSVSSMKVKFQDCLQSDGSYEVSDLRLSNYIQQNLHLKHVYDNNGVEKVKADLLNHLAVYVRIVTREDASGYLYGDDRVVLDYNWLRQVFVCLNPVTGRLTSISEEKIKNGTIKVRFYSVSKE